MATLRLDKLCLYMDRTVLHLVPHYGDLPPAVSRCSGIRVFKALVHSERTARQLDRNPHTGKDLARTVPYDEKVCPK